MKKLITIIIVIVIIIIAAMLLSNNDNGDTSTSPPPPPPPATVTPPPPGDTMQKLNTGFHGSDLATIPANATIIEITDNAVTPKKVTVKKGETVYFANKGEKKHWPATNIHPTHRVYKGSDIKDCKDADKAKAMFDACRGIESGTFYAFTFGEAGIWRFHDHLNSSLTGAITVE